MIFSTAIQDRQLEFLVKIPIILCLSVYRPSLKRQNLIILVKKGLSFHENSYSYEWFLHFHKIYLFEF